MNVLRNQLGIFILAMFILVATFSVSIMNYLSDSFYNKTTSVFTTLGVGNTTMTSISNFNDDTDSAIEMITTGMDFLMVMIVVLTIYSSFVSQNSISSYLLYFMASVLMSGILIYLFHQIYNSYVLASAGSIIDFTTFSDFVFVNFDNIILLNIGAFLLSFIFKRRSA
jgi:hypothetical protein